jgi:hypothetical protein
MDSGSPVRARRGEGLSVFTSARLRVTKMLPSRASASQHGSGRSAGARTAWPVRRSNSAWWAAQRTEPPVSSPCASETP